MGLRTVDVLQPLAARALGACGYARARTRAARDTLVDLRGQLAAPPAVRRVAHESCGRLVAETSELVAVAQSELNRIRTMSHAMSVTAPSARADAAPLIALVEEAISRVETELVALQTEVAQHLAVDRTPPSAASDPRQ